MIVGITGGIGTGKSTVVKMFKKLGNIAIYIADIEAKKLMHTSTSIKSKIINEFGNHIYFDDKLQRNHLANIVFTNKKKLEKLNAIVHPIVAEHFLDFVQKKNNKDYILYENAILFENKSNDFCDVIITVTAPFSVRLQRIVARDKSTEKEILTRIDKQWNDTKKIIQSNYLILNNSIKDTQEQVVKIHYQLMQKRLLFSKTSKKLSNKS